jgi:hypothetical protein
MDDGVFETLKDAKILLALASEKEIVNKFTRLIGIKN